MPNIWLLNIEEAQTGDTNYNVANSIPKYLANNMSKYLWMAKEHDICIVPGQIDDSFISYIKKIKKLKAGFKVFTLNKLSSPYSLIDSLYLNKAAINLLKNLKLKKLWRFVPYIQTMKTIQLANKTNISLNETPCQLIKNGVIENLNCKLFFKQLCSQNNIATPQWEVANNYADLQAILKNTQLSNKLILKKTKALGGIGNLSGNRQYLISKSKKWYQGNGKILIEHYYHFDKVLGSLAVLDKNSFQFMGVDEQIISNNSWQGLYYPARLNDDMYTDIHSTTLKIAEHCHKLGAVGYLNIDFGLIRDSSSGKLYALEANFRHNAFSLFLNNFAKKARILFYCNNFKTPAVSFSQLHENLSKIKIEGNYLLADNIESQKGVIIINHAPNLKSYGTLIFSPNEAYIKNVCRKLKGLE